MLTQPEFDAFVIEAKKATQEQANQVESLMDPAMDPFIGDGDDFGQGLINGVIEAAQKIKSLDLDQITEFGNIVSTFAISSNPANSDPGT